MRKELEIIRHLRGAAVGCEDWALPRRRGAGRGWPGFFVLPPLAQVALEEGETVARNLDAELEGRPLEAFTFHDKGFVVSVGTRRGVAGIAGITSGGRLAHLLKDAIEWEYRQSARHLRGRDPVAV